MFQKYDLNFDGVGATLTVSGIIKGLSSAVGSSKTAEYDGDSYDGRPSEIVRAICDEEGWPIGEIEETQINYESDGETPKTYTRNNQTAGKFINLLALESVSEASGEGDYVFFLGNDNKVYFVSKTAKASLKVKQASAKKQKEFFEGKASNTSGSGSSKTGKTTTNYPPKQAQGMDTSTYKKQVEAWYKDNSSLIPKSKPTNKTKLEEFNKKWPYYDSIGVKYVKKSAGTKVGFNTGLDRLPKWPEGMPETEYKRMITNWFTNHEYNRYPFELMDHTAFTNPAYRRVMEEAWKEANPNDKYGITYSSTIKLKEKKIDEHNQPDSVYMALNSAKNIVRGVIFAYYKKKNSKFGNGDKFDGSSSSVVAAPSGLTYNTTVTFFQVDNHPTGIEQTTFRIVDRHSKAVMKKKKNTYTYYFGIPKNTKEKVKSFGGNKKCKVKVGTGDTNANNVKGTVNAKGDSWGDQNSLDDNSSSKPKYIKNVPIAKYYEYYSGRSDNTVISFAPQYGDMLKAFGGSYVSAKSIKASRNEMVQVSAGGTKNGQYSTKILGLSSSDAKTLKKQAETLFAAYSTAYYKATLEVIGDPTITPMSYVYVAVYTKYGNIHHSSGVYMIMSVEDNITGGQYTSTLELQRVGTNKKKVVDYSTLETSSGSSTGSSSGGDSSVGNSNVTYQDPGTPSDNAKIEKAVQWAIGIANDNSHGYDQTHRTGPDYDCSSLVSTAYVKAGVNIGVQSSRTIGSACLSHGFKDVKGSVNFSTGAGMKRGDILVLPGSHVAMFIGGGKTVEAHINEKGSITGGKPGDQTGHEIDIGKYKNHGKKGYQHCYRYQG